MENSTFDTIPLAKDMSMPFDFDKCKYALNRMVVGPTGAGKSWSVVMPELLNTTQSSLVVPVLKHEMIDKFTDIFIKRGYKVEVMDFYDTENSTCFYDPMDYIKDAKDSIDLASRIVSHGAGNSSGYLKNSDPYWDDSAIQVLSAEIELIRLNSIHSKSRGSFADVLKLHRSIKTKNPDNRREELFNSNIDIFFAEAERLFPGNHATEAWKTIQGLPKKTASCINSIVNNAVNQFVDDTIVKSMKGKKRIRFSNMGENKTILFLNIPAFNVSLHGFINLLYSEMMKDLFETAQKHPNGTLPIHVDIIFDDFACFRFEKFEKYISIMRAANISVTLLLQDETQLVHMYGEHAASTIKNNCPTYIFFGGGNDISTARTVAERVNKPLNSILELPIGSVIVFKPGERPFIGERYPVCEDKTFTQIMEDCNSKEDMENE